ncbi:MAG: shikimate kinase [Thermoanaerobacteraceae bacterium]|nr:shikimate kinase [Thermoanaerobacteraceae bacterium]
MKNIALIGYMGAGKTTIGSVVASCTGLRFVDTDKYIVNRAHKSIKGIFEEDGESTFRIMENKLCRFLENRSGLIIATGGGIILNEDNMARLKKNSAVVYIKNDIETLYDRAKKTEARPLATDFEDFVRRYMDREPLYVKYADIVVDAEGKSVEDITMDILMICLYPGLKKKYFSS